MSKKQLSVLLIEADATRAQQLEAIFLACNYCSRITKVNSSQAAFELLEDAYKKHKVLPSLIISSLEPGDAEFVKRFKTHETFRHIPLIGYGNSTDPDEISGYYNEHINCFVVLPENEHAFTAVFSELFNFWSEIVKLVHHESMMI